MKLLLPYQSDLNHPMKLFAALITLVFIFFSKNPAYAQQPETATVNSIGFTVGYSSDRIKDTNFSPLNQQGSALVYSIGYARHSKNMFKINIEYGDGILESGLPNRLESSYYKANIGMAYLKGIVSEQRKINFYVGGTYNLTVLYLDWFDQDAFSFASTNGLSFSAAISSQLASKHAIESTLSIPVLQLLSRPPYNGIDEDIIENQEDPLKIILNGKLVSFNTYQAVDWNLNYSYEISRYFNWRLAYNLSFQNVKDLNRLTSLSNTISTSISFKF